jgi:penicillin-binding protein 2
MFKEFLDFLIYKLKQIVTSRLFPVTLVFIVLFSILIGRMYTLQIVQGASAQQDVEEITKRTVILAPTRGKIYDCNGKLLAYNQLVQNVIVTDDGSYRNGYERNSMLIRLIEILDRFGEKVTPSIDIYFDEEGVLRESFASENARLRFLRDMYGRTSVSQLSESELQTDAQAIMDFYSDKFGIGVNEDGSRYTLDPQTALKLLYIRYSMYANYYTRYNPSTVAEDVKEETVAAIREHAAELGGVDIEQTYKRVYNDAVYLCHILGYTGYASTEEIEALNAAGGNYYSGDVIGKAGIEASMEQALHGSSGTRTIYVNNLGQVKQEGSIIEAVAGDDIYLSIDVDLQKGIYHLLEQKLAGILINHLVNDDVNPEDSDHLIPVKQAYFQIINNNVLDLNLFREAEAGTAQRRIFYYFTERQEKVLTAIRKELLESGARSYNALGEDMQTYFTELYDVLQEEKILIRSRIETDSALYKNYRIDGTISLQEYLRGAVDREWVDMTLLDLDEKYNSSEEVYRALVDYIIERLHYSSDFSKELYRKLIYAGTINRCDIALAMYEQGVLEPDPEYEEKLLMRSSEVAFAFLQDKLQSIEITPAQLALDPYSAAATVVDVTSGRVIAMVSYPGYDNNRIYESGYYASLVADQSTPLFNSATQARTAPGSSFKMVTAAAAMEKGIIEDDTIVTTTGIFEAAGMQVKCWFYPDNHGNINVSQALMVSCNDFFAQMGYLLSLKSGEYSDSLGMEAIRQYASLLGLNEKSGVEIAEYEPVISDTSALTSAIGQGTNLYACSHLARYATAISTRGNIYNLTLLDHQTKADGTLVQSFRGQLVSKTILSNSSWNAIWKGMHMAVMGEDLSSEIWKVDAAGKTGTAEESELRPDNATFVSFAPFDDPKISVSVMIPHGYTSGNASELGRYIYNYYYGFLSYEDILSGEARDEGGNEINE